jgi:hypothetical protein
VTATPQDFLIVEVRITIPLPVDNITTWPEERCQKVAEETAAGLNVDYRAALAQWWVAS